MNSIETFAGFSASEWIAALTPVMGPIEAQQHIEGFFALLRESPSNGFALDAETFALLSLVNESCAGRVAAILDNYPDEFRDKVDAHINQLRPLPSR